MRSKTFTMSATTVVISPLLINFAQVLTVHLGPRSPVHHRNNPTPASIQRSQWAHQCNRERVQSISRVQGPPSLIASMRSPLECMHKNVLHFQFALSNLLFQKMKTCMRNFLAVSFMLFRCCITRYKRRLTSLVLSVTFVSR